MEIAGNVALVTGAASGLGEATARRLHAAGADVVLAEVADDRGRAVAAGPWHTTTSIRVANAARAC